MREINLSASVADSVNSTSLKISIQLTWANTSLQLVTEIVGFPLPTTSDKVFLSDLTKHLLIDRENCLGANLQNHLPVVFLYKKKTGLELGNANAARCFSDLALPYGHIKRKNIFFLH